MKDAEPGGQITGCLHRELHALAVLAAGCGQTRPDLTYDSSKQVPVIVYTETSAISPVYNPDVPVVVIYGDGTVIKKEGPYRLTTASLQGSLGELLGTLSDESFFGLKDVYEANPGKGAVLDGTAAAAAWAAVQQGEHVMEAQRVSQIYWEAAGTVYTFVYAHPELPGITES